MDQRRFPLPVFTNREDLVLPVSMNDDDTGEPLNLAGIVLETPGLAFTAPAWNVFTANLVLTSSTTLTIPTYPVGNNLLSVTLTVAAGQNIPTGSPVNIIDQATGQNAMIGYVTGYNAATGQLICQIGYSFQFEIRRAKPHESGVGYVTWYDFGVQSDVGPLLSASLGSGIFITDLGNIVITIPEAQFKQLNGDGTYTAALTFTDTVNTRQVFRAALPVIQGGVTN
jgi:hypothetical protein